MVRFPAPLASTPEEVDLQSARFRGDVEVPMTLADVGPTILDSLGFEPRYDIDGRSLFPGARVQGDHEIIGLTRRGIRGGCLISGDRAISLEFAPESVRYFRRPDSATPFAEMLVPTSTELDLAQRFKDRADALGIR